MSGINLPKQTLRLLQAKATQEKMGLVEVDPEDEKVTDRKFYETTSITMRRFMENYFMTFSRPLWGDTLTVQWMRHAKLECGSTENNITLFSGGNFRIPENMFDDYYKRQVIDIERKNVLCLNEIVMGASTCALALEADYTFNSIELLPDWAVFASHIKLVVETVVKYYQSEVDTMRLMIFRSEPKPKFKGGTWKVASGFHLIFNRSVSFEDGAQISHAVSEALKRLDHKLDVIDSIYMDRTAIRTSPRLRPPYSAKKIKCFFCNDPSKGKIAAPTVKCAFCVNRECLDNNVYKLFEVWDMACRKDDTMLAQLKKDMFKQIKMASIFGLCSRLVPLNYQSKIPRYTIFEMSKTAAEATEMTPREHARVKMIQSGNRDHQGKKVNLKGLFVSFKMMNVKSKDERGVNVNLDSHIIQQAMVFLRNLSANYSSCSLQKLMLYKNMSALSVSVTGDGSTYCMKKEDYHSQNRASIWILMEQRQATKVFVGCFSSNCSGDFKQIYDDVCIKSAHDLIKACKETTSPETNVGHKLLPAAKKQKLAEQQMSMIVILSLTISIVMFICIFCVLNSLDRAVQHEERLKNIPTLIRVRCMTQTEPNDSVIDGIVMSPHDVVFAWYGLSFWRYTMRKQWSKITVALTPGSKLLIQEGLTYAGRSFHVTSVGLIVPTWQHWMGVEPRHDLLLDSDVDIRTNGTGEFIIGTK